MTELVTVFFIWFISVGQRHYFVSVGQHLIFFLKAERTEGRKQYLIFSFKSRTEGRKLTCKFQNLALCLTLLSNLEKQESIVPRLINNTDCVN
jgi:hypothetical protein